MISLTHSFKAFPSEQPPTQQKAAHQSKEPNQGSHLVLRQTELAFDPVEDFLIREDESTKRLPNSEAITLPVHEDESTESCLGVNELADRDLFPG